MNLATASAAAGLTAINVLLNGGTFNFYTGSMPATPETATTGTLLVSFTFSTTAFGAYSFTGGFEQATASFTANSVNPVASGTVGYVRGFRADGTTVVADYTIGTSGTDIVIGSTTISTGVPVTLSSFLQKIPAV